MLLPPDDDDERYGPPPGATMEDVWDLYIQARIVIRAQRRLIRDLTRHLSPTEQHELETRAGTAQRRKRP